MSDHKALLLGVGKIPED